MRRIAIAAAVLAALAGGATAPSAAHASCAFVVVWHDRAYFAEGRPETQAHPGTPVRGALEPDCNDTGGPAGAPTPIVARRISGVPPGVALLARDTVLVASGYFPKVTNVLTGATMPTDETHGCTLGGPVRITGPAQPGFGALDVHVDDSTVHLHHLLRGSAQVYVDGHTRIHGLTRNGQPYIGEGQLVRVDAQFCKVPGSIGTMIVGRRIVPAGPIVAPPTAEDILGDDWRGSPGVVSRATGGHALAVAIVLLVAALGIGTVLTTHRRRSLPPPTG
jgi:Family of unknown function (DUF6281)